MCSDARGIRAEPGWKVCLRLHVLKRHVGNLQVPQLLQFETDYSAAHAVCFKRLNRPGSIREEQRNFSSGRILFSANRLEPVRGEHHTCGFQYCSAFLNGRPDPQVLCSHHVRGSIHSYYWNYWKGSDYNHLLWFPRYEALCSHHVCSSV